MVTFGTSAGRPIGLDIGHQAVKAVQLTAGGAVRVASCFPRSGSGLLQAGEADQIAQALRRQGFVGDEVVLAVPPEEAICGILDLPPRSSGAPIEQLARTELASMHDCDPRSFEVCCWDLPPDGGRRQQTHHVMAVGCRHEVANALLDASEQARLSVLALDVGALAVARACKPLLDPGDSITAVVDLGWGAARLILIRQETILYERRVLDCGLSNLAGKIEKQFEVGQDSIVHLIRVACEARSDELESESADVLRKVTPALESLYDKLCHEMQAPLAYVLQRYHGCHARRVVVCGGGAVLPGLAERVSATLDMQVTCARMEELARVDGSLLGGTGPEMVTALGLAMAEAHA